MAFLSRTIKQITIQLGALNGSQKAVVVLMTIIVGLAVIWAVKFSIRGRMVPLMDQIFSADEIGSITAQLEKMGEEYQVKGSMIMVRDDCHDQIFYHLVNKGIFGQLDNNLSDLFRLSNC